MYKIHNYISKKIHKVLSDNKAQDIVKIDYAQVKFHHAF